MRNCCIFNGGRCRTTLECSRFSVHWLLQSLYCRIYAPQSQPGIISNICVTSVWSEKFVIVTVIEEIAVRPGKRSFSPSLYRLYSLRSRPVGLKRGRVFVETVVYSIVNSFKCCTGLSHLQGNSNSINRNFNIYSLDGFPPIIYDHQRDVNGDHLFLLWMGLRGTKTSPASPLN